MNGHKVTEEMVGDLMAERQQMQAAIDNAYGAMHATMYVGGFSEREAWRIAFEALYPFATQPREKA